MSNHKDNSTYKGGRRSQHGHSEWPSLISHDSLPDLGNKTVEELSMTIKLKTRDENISNLLEIFPEVDKDVLNDILEQCGDDVPEATDKVIEILEEGRHRIKQEETDLAIIACSLLSDEATSAKRLNIFSNPAERLQGESDQIGNTGINSQFSNVSPQSLIKVGQESHILSASPFPVRLKDIGNSAVSSHRVDDSDLNFVKRSEVEVQPSSVAPMIGQLQRTNSSNRRVETRLSVSGDKSQKSSFVNHSSELTECLRGSKLVVCANNYSIGGVKNISGKDCFSSNLHISGTKAQQLESFVHKSDRMHKTNLQEFLSPSNHNIDESFTEMKKCVNGLRDFSEKSPSKKPSDLINGWDELYEQLDLDPDEIGFVPGNFTNTNVENWRWQAMESSFTSVNSATVPTVTPKTTPKKRNRRSKKKNNAQRMEVNNLSKENSHPMIENREETEENLFYPKETLNIPEAVSFTQNMDQSDMTTKVRNVTESKSDEAHSRNIEIDLSTQVDAHISYFKNSETKINLSPDAEEFHPQPSMAYQQAAKLGQQRLSLVKMKGPSGNLDPQPQTPVAGSPKKKKSSKAKKRERGLSGGLNQQQLAATEANGQREHVQDDHLEEMEYYEDPIDPLGWHAILSPRTLGRPQTQRTPEKKNTFSTLHQSQQRQMPPWAVGFDSSDVTRSNEGSIKKFASVSNKTRSQSIISNSSSSSGEWKQDLKKNHFRQKPLASHLITNETHPGPIFGEPVSMLRDSPQKMQSVSSTLASRLPPSLQVKAPPLSSPVTPKNLTAESLMSKGQVLRSGAPSIGLKGAVTTNSEILKSSPSETVLFKNKLAFRGVKTPVDVIRLYILEKQPVLVILRGLPGSGKSYLANQLIAEGQKMGTEGVILSTDDYFMQRGIYKFNRNDLGTAHDWNKQRALNYVKQSKSPIIIDNTNTTLWEFLPYAEVALKHKYDVQVFEPDTTWSLKVRELARRNCHGVTKDAIVRMKERYEKISTEDLLKAASSSRRTTQVPSAAETRTEEQPESNADQPQDAEPPLIPPPLPMEFSSPLNPPLKPHKWNPPQQQHRLPQHYPLFLQQPALQQQLSPLMRPLHPQQTALQQQPSPLLRSSHPQKPRPQQQLSPLIRPLLLQQPVLRQQLSPLLHPLLPQQPALHSLISPHLHRLLPQQSVTQQQTSPFQHQLPPHQPSLLQHPLLPQKPAPKQPGAEAVAHVKPLLCKTPVNHLDNPLGVSHGEDPLASSEEQSPSSPATVWDVLGLSEWFEAKEQRVPKKFKKSGGSSETENKSSGITVEYLSQSLKNAFVNLSDSCKHTAAPSGEQEACRPIVSEKTDLLSAGEASHVSVVEETQSVSAEPTTEINTATEEGLVFPGRLEKFICQEDSSCILNEEDGSEDLGYPVDDQCRTLSEYSALDEAEKGSQLNCSCSTVGSFKSCCSDRETMLSKYGDMDSELGHHEHPSWEVNPEGCLRNGLDVKAASSYFQTEESQNVDTPATVVDVEEFDYRNIQDNKSNEEGENSVHQEDITRNVQKKYSDASASSGSESEDEEIVSENDIPLKNSESSLSILDQYFDSSPPMIDQDCKAEVALTRNQKENTLRNDVFPASLVDYSDSENENDDKVLGREGWRFEGGHRSTPSPDESLSRHSVTPLQEADDTCLTESSAPTSKEGSPKLEGNENSDSSPSRRARKKRVKKGRNPGPFIDDSLKVKSKTESWSSFYKQHTDGMRTSPVEVTNSEPPSPSTELRSESSQCDSYYFSLLHKLNSSAFNKLQPIDLSLSDVRVISATWSEGGESSPADTQGSFVSRKSETNDRSTNTDEAIEKEEVDLETLQNCFPEYSRKQLEYTMVICHNNLEWVCSHLLDSPALIDIEEEEEEDKSPVQLKRDSSASKLKSLAELCSLVAKQTNQVDQDDLEMQIIEAGETRLQKIETFGWSRIHSYERGRFNDGGFDYFSLEDFRGSPSSEASWDFPPKQMVPQYKTKPPNNVSGSSNYDQPSSNKGGLLSKSPGGGEISYAHTPSAKTPGPKCLTTPPPTTPFEYMQDPGATTSATTVNVPIMPREFIKCLELLYGPLNIPVGDEGLPLDDVIARKIYNCLKLQATKKVINNTSDQQLQNDEALARALQEEEDSQEQKKSNHLPLRSGKKLVAGWSNQMPAWMYQGGMTSGLQGHGAPAAGPLVTGGGNSKKPKGSQGKKHKPFNLQKRLSAGGIKSVWAGVKRRGQADSLQSIMEEEQAREESQKEQMRLFELTGDTQALATRIKRNKLAELFPSLSPEFLEDIFMNAGYSMEDTVKILAELYNISPAPMSRERQEEIMEEAKERSREEYYSQYIFPEDVYEPYDEDASPMTYEELRNEAQFYRGLARECQEKASRYQAEGMSGAALFYRQKVKDYKSYESDSNQRAAEVLFEKGKERLTKENTLDLHFYHLDEAVSAVNYAISLKEEESRLRPDRKSTYLNIVTGRGRNSKDGVPILKPAIMNHLRERCLRFEEKSPGMLKVYFSR